MHAAGRQARPVGCARRVHTHTAACPTCAAACSSALRCRSDRISALAASATWCASSSCAARMDACPSRLWLLSDRAVSSCTSRAWQDSESAQAGVPCQACRQCRAAASLAAGSI